MQFILIFKALFRFISLVPIAPLFQITMRTIKRLIPHLSLGIASLVLLLTSKITTNQEVKDILINIFSNTIFFFIAFLFYDIVKQIIINKEKEYLTDYIKSKMANDIFVSLYFMKKIIHGYNLETNTLENIFSVVDYSRNEVNNCVKHQNYLGFQIFKNIDEVHSLFNNAANDNFILKYSSHIDTISIIRIANNLARLASFLKNENNFDKCAESAIEYSAINGKLINQDNDEKYLLLKKTKHKDRFVVYDSGYFDKQNIDKLLNRYVLKEGAVKKLTPLLLETFSLMKYWLPEVVQLSKNEGRFRIVKEFFSQNTKTKTRNAGIYVADIVELGKGDRDSI